jgi:hypothetical protein
MPLPFKKQLLKEFDTYLGPRGFKRRSDRFYGDRYDRQGVGGRQSLSIASHLRKPALVLDPAFAGIRLDAVEEEVFRYEEKTELISDHDALQRNTIGLRLDARELINIASNRYTINSEKDCEIVGQRYIREMLERAERFWSDFSSIDVILSVLKQVPGKGRDYAGTDLFASERAIVLAKQQHGMRTALELAGEITTRLAESTRNDLAAWLQRAEGTWGTSGASVGL